MSDKYEFILDIIQTVAAFASPLIAFLLGRLSTKSSRKKEVAQKQFECFYLPFLQLYVRELMWEIRFFEIKETARLMFLDLIMNNYQYAGHRIQKLIPDFYTTWYELDRKTQGVELDFIVEPIANMDKLFYTLTQSVFLEYISICKVLGLPAPALPLLPNSDYLQ